jgi:hypothetical protein
MLVEEETCFQLFFLSSSDVLGAAFCAKADATYAQQSSCSNHVLQPIIATIGVCCHAFFLYSEGDLWHSEG